MVGEGAGRRSSASGEAPAGRPICNCGPRVFLYTPIAELHRTCDTQLSYDFVGPFAGAAASTQGRMPASLPHPRGVTAGVLRHLNCGAGCRWQECARQGSRMRKKTAPRQAQHSPILGNLLVGPWVELLVHCVCKWVGSGGGPTAAAPCPRLCRCPQLQGSGKQQECTQEARQRRPPAVPAPSHGRSTQASWPTVQAPQPRPRLLHAHTVYKLVSQEQPQQLLQWPANQVRAMPGPAFATARQPLAAALRGAGLAFPHPT